MSNTQIILQFIGWGFLFYLSNRTLRRSEISRLKDSLVAQIKKDTDWLNSQLLDAENKTLQTEQLFTSRITQIDFHISQLNTYSRFKLIDENCLLSLWDLDIFQLKSSDKYTLEINDISCDLIESIETSYTNNLFKTSFIRRWWLMNKPEIFGITSILIILTLLFNILSFLNLNK